MPWPFLVNFKQAPSVSLAPGPLEIFYCIDFISEKQTGQVPVSG